MERGRESRPASRHNNLCTKRAEGRQDRAAENGQWPIADCKMQNCICVFTWKPERQLVRGNRLTASRQGHCPSPKSVHHLTCVNNPLSGPTFQKGFSLLQAGVLQAHSFPVASSTTTCTCFHFSWPRILYRVTRWKAETGERVPRKVNFDLDLVERSTLCGQVEAKWFQLGLNRVVTRSRLNKTSARSG